MTSKSYPVSKSTTTVSSLVDGSIDSGFTNGATPHIVHMSVKPQDIVDEEDARLKAGGKDREGNERTPGCRCIIM